MDTRICDECGVSYAYFDSPAATKCFCGGELRELNDSEYVDAINGKLDTNYPTVSC